MATAQPVDQTGQSQVIRLTEPTETKRVGRSLWSLALGRLRRDRLTMVALSVIGIMIILALAAPLVGQALNIDYTRTNADATFLTPGAPGHILGTDQLGRDHFVRLFYAAQISLGIAVTAAILSLSLGLMIGMVTGYFGGWIDDLTTWFIATLSSIPDLFLLLIIVAVLRGRFGPLALVLTLGFLGWLGTARLVRGETLAIREREYIVSARSVGASSWRIITQHILPNLLSVAIISLALDIASLMLVESILSFLGLGVQEPTPSWGNMLSKAQDFLSHGPWLAFAPGILISVAVLCFFLIGDGLRDAFDPTSRK